LVALTPQLSAVKRTRMVPRLRSFLTDDFFYFKEENIHD
jgi:hypothetical protein